MAKMRYEYLGIIHRNDLNILFKKGYIVLCTIHVKTISGNDSVPEEYIRELLKNVSPLIIQVNMFLLNFFVRGNGLKEIARIILNIKKYNRLFH